MMCPAASASAQVYRSGNSIRSEEESCCSIIESDETHSNSYTVWKQMGSPQNPTAEQYASTKGGGTTAAFGVHPSGFDVTDGKVIIDTALPRQATSLMCPKVVRSRGCDAEK